MQEVRPGLLPVERARCQHLVFGVVRHAGRLEAALDALIAHPPRFPTRAVLLLAGYELIESLGPSAEPGHAAKIVHHAVERAKSIASPAEVGLVNAVVRRLAERLAGEAEPPRFAPAADLARYYSHPDWLVRRWLAAFGAEDTRALLEWNQRPGLVRVRWRGPGDAPAWLLPTPWPGFFEVPQGRWPDLAPFLENRAVYPQDPGTRIAVGLLKPVAGEPVLDLCAAPGGKTLLIADSAGAAGAGVVAFDLPGPSLQRLRENLSASGVKAGVAEGDLWRDPARTLREGGFPETYPAVLIDVPCSNTGVMRHRIDVKWRLQEADFDRHVRQQLALLSGAARLVSPGGRLVYSTCSIDPGENSGVVKTFLARAGCPFTLEASETALPWACGHDGAAAFLLRRS